MRLRLIDGSIVDLSDRPQWVGWIHDNKSLEMLLKRDYRVPIDAIIAKGKQATAEEVRHCEVLFHHYAERQVWRLKQLRENMERCGVVEFID